jgi:hypothetical protein
MYFLPRLSIDQVAIQLNIFACGLVDSLSVHKTLPLLITNREIALLTFKIFGANSCLVLGSIYLYHNAILPGLGFLRNYMVDGQNDNVEIPGMQTLFYSFMVVPVYILCYSCSTVWYQELADSMKKLNKKIAPPPLMKSVVESSYATVAWLCVFTQLQLLKTVIPFILLQLLSLLSNSEIFPDKGILSLLRKLLIFIISNSLLISKGLVLFLTAALYGWYSFDPHWIATNTDPNTRFGIIERHWAYYVGFGSPYVLLLNSTSFFVGYGLFLSLFPFSIILGCMSDHSLAYKNIDRPLPPIRIFKIAQTQTLMILKFLNKKSDKAKKSMKKL